MLLDSQWIAKLVESDDPSSVLDQLSIESPAVNAVGEPRSQSLSPRIQAKAIAQSPDDGDTDQKRPLIDLTVLRVGFPNNDIPWFKVNRIVLTSKTTAFPKKNKLCMSIGELY
ncbi:hypothetical protein EST38_g7317 [Candolleomyces aberdarensis]|uniref:Uncharacterized protein n=1 Tax=Candolleomyces aberdarensis TaxID=2316362 RepID=A0A4Q2DFF2_9AGAR|nr:hypothetical protein EST38_g7317 [Candolleomyces aberdarensis]